MKFNKLFDYDKIKRATYLSKEDKEDLYKIENEDVEKFVKNYSLSYNFVKLFTVAAAQLKLQEFSNYCGLDNCEEVNFSTKVKNSSFVMNSCGVTDSHNVDESKCVDTSEFIQCCQFVNNSSRIINSQQITCCSFVRNSSNIINSQFVKDSNSIINGFFIQDCHNVKNCYFGYNLNNVSNAIFCDFISDTPADKFYVVNKEVSYEVFNSLKQNLDMLREVSDTPNYTFSFHQNLLLDIPEIFWDFFESLPYDKTNSSFFYVSQNKI